MVEHPIDRITLHHSAGPSNLARNAPGQIRSYQRLHQTSNGWPDIAYHFLIDAAGNIYEGRDPLYRGDTGTNYDPTGHFLVCFDGDYGAAEPSEAQLAAAVDLFAWACQIYDVNPETLGGHRDFAATECPGDALYTVIANGSMAEAISARMAEGELQFTDICGDAAETTIARIEAGA